MKNNKFSFAILVLLITCVSANATKPGFSEYKIKAGFIYNFTRFIKWPEKSFMKDSGSFNLCFLGEYPFKDYFRPIEGKSIKGRKLTIKKIKAEDNLKQCQILFISKSEKKEMKTLFQSLEGVSVLTVGDVEGFAQSGGIIGMVMKGNRVLLEINLDAAKREEFHINTKLLTISTIVKGN